MYFFLSGEGSTDLGTSKDRPGPLAMIVDQIIQEHHEYSPLECGRAVHVNRSVLKRIKSDASKSRNKRSVRLPSAKIRPEYRDNYENAKVLSRISQDFIDEKPKNDRDFVAVLFHDTDTPKEQDWKDMRNAILTGFHDGGIEPRGVASVARPISEAWWLSALDRKVDPKRDGTKYEESRRGKAKGEHHLKKELGDDAQRDALVAMVKSKEIDYKLIDSDSFLVFRRDFETAVGLEYLHHT